MSEYEPITAELRELMGDVEPRVGEDGVVTAKYVTPEAWGEFARRCDAIDAVHAGLERENAELRQRVAVLDNRSESMHIGNATITVTPTLDWTGVARELRAIADTLGTGTCHVEETERFECLDSRYKSFDYNPYITVHVMECSECGSTYEHVNGDYEYCPHCGRRIEVDE